MTDEFTARQRRIVDEIREIAPELRHLLTTWHSSSARYAASEARGDHPGDPRRRGALTQLLETSEAIDGITRRYCATHPKGE